MLESKGIINVSKQSRDCFSVNRQGYKEVNELNELLRVGVISFTNEKKS